MEEENNFYEVDLYRIYKDRVEAIGHKFFKSTSEYTGDTCIVKNLDKDTKIMKTITKLKWKS